VALISNDSGFRAQHCKSQRGKPLQKPLRQPQKGAFMKKNFLSVIAVGAIIIGSIAIVPFANAAANDSFVFNMVKSAGASACLSEHARGRVTLSDLVAVQNMHIEVFDLPPNTDFTIFVINTPTAPFVPAWYQGDLTTNAAGRGVADVTGIFSDETFILNPGIPAVPVELHHLGMWFADPAQAVNAGCAGTVTPFDGDHNAGIQVLNTANFSAAKGPLGRLQ
jgi:hypothetical protein